MMACGTRVQQGVRETAWRPAASRLALFLLTLGMLLSAAPPSFAAKVTAPGLHAAAVKASDFKVSSYWPTDPVSCDLILEGEIVEGDREALEKGLSTILDTWNSFSFFLCLRSPGGNMKEAIRIAQFVRATQRPSIATVVEDSQTCASACALIFLAGNAPARVGAFPQRFLHPRGRLLYHASRLDLSGYSEDALMSHLTTQNKDGSGLKERIADLYAEGLRDVQSVLNTFKGLSYQREDLGEPWVRQSLFLEMFAQDPNEWICADNVDSAGRWRIQVFGFKPPKTPAKPDYEEMCRNAFNWRSDSFVEGSENTIDEFFDLKMPKPQSKKPRKDGDPEPLEPRVTMLMQAPMSQITCVVEGDAARREPVTEESEHQVTFENGGGMRMELGATAFFKAGTPLPDLPGVRPRGPVPPVDADRTFRAYPNSRMNGCSYRIETSPDAAACEKACASDGLCQAFSYNRAEKSCQRKHTLTALRLDPFSVSGVPDGVSAERSSRPVGLEPEYLYYTKRLAGEAIGAPVQAEDVAGCEQMCETDRTCLAIEYEASSKQCRRFSTLNGLSEESEQNAQMVEIRIKRQH